jgi:hypothetical protein
MGSNFYIDTAGNPAYITSSFATNYQQNRASGIHAWYTAPSGTAGNAISFTQAMTLNASGNLGLGVTPSAWAGAIKSLQIGSLGGTVITGNTSAGGTSSFGQNFYFDSDFRYAATGNATRYAQFQGNHQWFTAPSGTAGDAISFTQAMTLDASGRLLVGTTTAKADNNLKIQLNAGTNQATVFAVNRLDDYGLLVGYNNLTGADYANITVVPNVPLVFSTSNTERARIDSSGNLLVGLTSATGVALLQVSGPIRTTGYTVATLPAGTVGMRTYVTDALAPSFGVAVAGSGAVTIPVFYDGANWIVA